jgi:hypothetical protein
MHGDRHFFNPPKAVGPASTEDLENFCEGAWKKITGHSSFSHEEKASLTALGSLDVGVKFEQEKASYVAVGVSQDTWGLGVLSTYMEGQLPVTLSTIASALT